jgi:hypothetical protein
MRRYTRTTPHLVDLLLLIDTELARAAVDQQEETANNGQDLEEVVLGEILVRVGLVELNTQVSSRASHTTPRHILVV